MNREDLISQLQGYKSRYHEEMLFASSIVDLLYKEPDCFKRNLLSGHITGSAWVLNPGFSKTLLIHHKKLDKWLQPGGHADGEEDLHKVAKSELGEETGVVNSRLFSEAIFDIDIHEIPKFNKIPKHNHYDIRYLFIVDDAETLNANHESLDIRWWLLKDVLNLTNNENSILRMVKKNV